MGSDHCPILLASSKNDNPTKKPFRVNISWFSDPSCSQLIKDNWKCNIQGSYGFRLTRGLAETKNILREWNYNQFGNISTQISKLESQLAQLTRTINPQNNSRIEVPKI